MNPGNRRRTMERGKNEVLNTDSKRREKCLPSVKEVLADAPGLGITIKYGHPGGPESLSTTTFRDSSAPGTTSGVWKLHVKSVR